VLDTSAEVNLFVKHPRYAEQSAALFKAVQTGDPNARHRFLLLHLPLARKISQRLCRWFGMLPEDAEQIAFFGLMEAARRFRPEFGCQFSTYATPWIKQKCQRLGPEFALMIHLPANAFWPSFRLRLTLEGLVSTIGTGGAQDLLMELDLRDPKAGRYLRDLVRVTGIKSLSDRKEPEYRAARQIVKPSVALIDGMKQAEIAARIQKAVSKLRTREAQIIRLRYGFDGCPGQTLIEVGQLFGLTRERVRQIQAKAEERLRVLLDGELDDLPMESEEEQPSSAGQAVQSTQAPECLIPA
jgi:RNA polymerase primary sigma factor